MVSFQSCCPVVDYIISPNINNPEAIGVDCDSTYTGTLNLLWTTKLNPNPEEKTDFSLLLFEKDLIINNDPNNAGLINSINPIDGKTQWNYDTKREFLKGCYKLGNTILFPNESSTSVLDFDMRAERLLSDEPLELTDAIELGEYFYVLNSKFGSALKPTIKRIHKDGSGQWENIFTGDYGDDISQPGFWLNPNGDSILILNLRKNGASKSEFIGRNLNRMHIPYYLIHLTDFQTTKNAPIIFNDKAIFTMKNEEGILALDLLTGQIA